MGVGVLYVGLCAVYIFTVRISYPPTLLPPTLLPPTLLPPTLLPSYPPTLQCHPMRDRRKTHHSPVVKIVPPIMVHRQLLLAELNVSHSATAHLWTGATECRRHHSMASSTLGFVGHYQEHLTPVSALYVGWTVHGHNGVHVSWAVEHGRAVP